MCVLSISSARSLFCNLRHSDRVALDLRAANGEIVGLVHSSTESRYVIPGQEGSVYVHVYYRPDYDKSVTIDSSHEHEAFQDRQGSEWLDKHLSNSDDNNCSVRALMSATGLRYSMAYKHLEASGRKKGKGTTLTVLENAMTLSGTAYTTQYVYRQLSVAKILTRHFTGLTGFITIPGHVIGVIDGKIDDFEWGHYKNKKVSFMTFIN